MSDLEGRVSNDERNPVIKATDIYFRPKFFEKSGKIYEWLGVKPFRKLVMGSVGRAFKAAGGGSLPGTYFIGKGDDKDIGAYETLARINEAVHMPLMVLASSDLASSITGGDIWKIVGASAGVLLNGYCTMLQRYNRAKAYKILEKRGER